MLGRGTLPEQLAAARKTNTGTRALLCCIVLLTQQLSCQPLFTITTLPAQIDGFPPCVSNKKAPSAMTVTGYDHEGDFIGKCPSSVVPPILSIQPLLRITITIEDEFFDLDAHFTPSSWLEEYSGGAVTVQTCILSKGPRPEQGGARWHGRSVGGRVR